MSFLVKTPPLHLRGIVACWAFVWFGLGLFLAGWLTLYGGKPADASTLLLEFSVIGGCTGALGAVLYRLFKRYLVTTRELFPLLFFGAVAGAAISNIWVLTGLSISLYQCWALGAACGALSVWFETNWNQTI